jgi:outer membrane protein assembly factor BamB
VAWSFETDALLAGEIVCSSDLAVVADLNGWVQALDLSNGQMVWRYRLSTGAVGTAAIDGDGVILGTSSDVVCLDLHDGREVWRAVSASPIPARRRGANCPLILPDDGSPLGNMIVFADDRIALFDRRTGARRFEETIAFDPHVSTGPCADDRHVFLPYSSQEIARVSRRTARFETPIGIEGKVTAGPVVADDLLLYGTSRASVVAVDLQSLRRRWSLDASGGWMVTSRPAMRDGVAYIASPGGTVRAVDLASGSIRWERDCGGEVGRSLLVCGSCVFVVSSRALTSLSSTTGAVQWEFEEAGAGEAGAGPVFSGTTILASMGMLRAFRGPG